MKRWRMTGTCVLAAFLLLGSVPVQAAETQTDGSAYTIKVESGLKGVIRDTGYLPVQIELTAEEDFKGSIQIPCQVRPWNRNISSVIIDSLLPDISTEGMDSAKERDYIYRQKVELDAGESAHLNFNLAVPDDIQHLTIQLLDESGRILKEQVSPLDENRYNQRIIIGVVSSEAGATEAIEAQQYGETLRCVSDVVEMTAEEIPTDMRLLSQMDALVLIGVMEQSLSADIQIRLSEWEQGDDGALIQATSADDAVGRLKEYFTDERIEEAGVIMYSSSIQNDLAQIPVKQQPSMWLYGAVLILYAVFAGPGLYLILKRLKKRYYLWAGITAAAAGFTVIIGVLGSQTRMRAPFISYAETYVQSGESVVRQVDFGIQAPYNQEYSLYVDSSFDLVPAMDINDMGVTSEEAGRFHGELVDIEYQEDRYKITISQNSAFSPEYFTIHCQEKIMGGITAQGIFTEKGLVGSVRNNAPYDMKDVFVLMPESIVYVGNLPSGKEVQLEDCIRFTYSIGGLNKFFAKVPEFSNREETAYLQEILMNKVFELYQSGSLKSYVFGIMQKDELDFQLDSGYEAYGYSLYRASADIRYRNGDEIFCPFGQYRMKLSEGDYVDQQWPASYMTTDGEMTIYYDLEGTLEQLSGEEVKVTGLSMYTPDYAESEGQIAWKGTISFFNREKKRYDQIAQWQETMTEEMLEPYLGDDGILTVKYESAFLVEPKRSENDQMIIPSINLSGVVTENAEN